MEMWKTNAFYRTGAVLFLLEKKEEREEEERSWDSCLPAHEAGMTLSLDLYMVCCIQSSKMDLHTNPNLNFEWTRVFGWSPSHGAVWDGRKAVKQQQSTYHHSLLLMLEKHTQEVYKTGW